MLTNNDENKMQYLFFILDDMKFAVKAEDVKEIVDYDTITKVPKSHKAIRGVTNIRGDIIPVVDPKMIFHNKLLQRKSRTSFVIFNIFNKQKQTFTYIALMVDLVIEVEDINSENILQVPEFGTKIPSHFLHNMIRFNDEYIMVLDITTVLDIEQFTKVD